jgi:hypothetical protein
MFKWFTCCLIGLLTTGQIATAQRFGAFGFAYKVGYSTNAEADENGATNPALNSVVTSTSATAFTTYRFSTDTAWHIFPHVKIGVGPGFRGGVFDVGGTPTRISMSFLDVDLILPAHVRLSQNLELQFAIGCNLGFLARQNANTPKAEVFQPGVISEWGIGTKNGSFLGFSVGRSFATYPIWNTSFMFALSSGDLGLSRSRK